MSESESHTMQPDDERPRDKVAVIAVHGVGSQAPYVTACEIAGLLQRANRGVYSEFNDALLELSVSKRLVPLGTGAAFTAARNAHWYIRTRFARSKMAADDAAPIALSDDIAFTQQALRGVEVDPELARFHTSVLNGTRRTAGRTTAVDVFEMYWADLSHLGGWLGKVLGQFYQLLFHVASLGQKTVELASTNAAAADRSRLTPLLMSQTFVEALLAGVLPIGNIALFLAAVPAIVVLLLGEGATRDRWSAIGCGVLFGLVLAAGLLYALWRGLRKADLPAWRSRWQMILFAAGVPCAFAVSVAGAVWVTRAVAALEAPRFTSLAILFVAVSLLCAAVLAWAGNRFARHRASGPGFRARLISVPGVTTAACLLLWIALVAYGLVHFASNDETDRIVSSVALAADGIFRLLQAGWTAFVLVAWAACLSGGIAAVRTRDARVKAAVWTGKIALFMPATLFMAVTLMIWSALEFALNRYARGVSEYVPAALNGVPLGAHVRSLLDLSASPGFNLFFLFIVAAMMLAIVAFLPSVIRESSPREGRDTGQSRALGNWLDAGFMVLRASGYLVLAGLLVVLPLVSILLWYGITLRGIEAFVGNDWLFALTAIIVGTTGVVVVFRAAIFDAFGKALDIALDVDTWLRERPLEHNPRGRILLRYVALLDYVVNGPSRYDKIVIVSHSQGTVITADLLRYLKHHPLKGNALPPVTLMTFGSPLRQLYGLRFPHLYGWAREPAAAGTMPDPAALGVARWVNGYRSGDYVGRNLWSSDDPWAISVSMPSPGRTVDCCAGAGAHTHYFDGTATPVGQWIDREI